MVKSCAEKRRFDVRVPVPGVGDDRIDIARGAPAKFTPHQSSIRNQSWRIAIAARRRRRRHAFAGDTFNRRQELQDRDAVASAKIGGKTVAAIQQTIDGPHVRVRQIEHMHIVAQA